MRRISWLQPHMHCCCLTYIMVAPAHALLLPDQLGEVLDRLHLKYQMQAASCFQKLMPSVICDAHPAGHRQC